jgi:pantoate--beta-alanine ligase
MNIVTTTKQWQSIRQSLVNETIGFVPTMGHLHAGHMALCKRSINDNDLTIASIFINPTQFNQASDFEKYPRTYDADIAKLSDIGVDYLFMPDREQMYPDGYEVKVTESNESMELEGKHRPGHFDGVLTVVLKLFNLIQPARAYFGEKDFQQLLLIKKMVHALFLPVEIIACKTVRADDMLALSSRNSRLNEEERELAASFPNVMHRAKTNADAVSELTELGFKVEYVADKWDRRLGAVWLGGVRLIDNIER